jgi:RHS repeat-associated protein
MVAEYQPATGKYYYYTTDQINSTRVVTDDEGNVVYSAVHDPYGGVQQTWVNTFNPGWKFSGKEQDAESGLYYFGARYYDSTLYRFLSPDPVIPADRALYNPQRWNLYGYCLNDPINNIEISGKWTEKAHRNMTYRAMLIAFSDWPPPVAKALADIVATACAYVDVDPTTRSTPCVGCIEGEIIHWPSEEQILDWHFPDNARLIEMINVAETTLDPYEFGKALHVIQDFFAHFNYGSNHVGDTVLSIIAKIFPELGLKCYDPDDPWAHSDMALDALRITLDLCIQYERRLSEYFFCN